MSANATHLQIRPSPQLQSRLKKAVEKTGLKRTQLAERAMDAGLDFVVSQLSAKPDVRAVAASLGATAAA